MERFRKLGISESIIRTIEEERFEKPSEIQEKSIPSILAGKDVIAGSATGSGKTLAFASRIIENSEKGKGIQALILVPTRELAEQVTKALKKFSKYKPLAITAVYGGVSINPQIQDLMEADVVIGTPGRILDHMERRTINFDNVDILVLDEADRMLDMGFIDDVKRIINQCPAKRQTLLFSATISEEVSYIARKYMKEPVQFLAEQYVDPKKLLQVYYDTPDSIKFSLLVHLLKHERAGLVMVFCNTRTNTDFVANNLKRNGIDAVAIHGGFSQEKRNRVMNMFHSNRVGVLVCTDVAARGLDIKGVSHIYNYDLPKVSKDYIHRIGRTARAGKEGKAINILASRDYDNFTKILENKDLTIKKEELPKVERVMIRWIASPRGRFNRFEHRNRYGERRDYTERRDFAVKGGYGNKRFGGYRREGRGDESRSFGHRRENRPLSHERDNRRNERFGNRMFGRSESLDRKGFTGYGRGGRNFSREDREKDNRDFRHEKGERFSGRSDGRSSKRGYRNQGESRQRRFRRRF